MNGVDPLQRSPVDWHLPRGWIDGLTLANDTTDATNDIVIAEGVCRSTVNIVGGAASTKTKDQRDIEISESVIKQLDVPWAPGNGGGRSGSAIGNSTWHAYGIGGPWLKDSVFFHDSATQSSVLAALPSGYTAYRRIGSIIRASATILGFIQYGDEFWLKSPRLDFDSTIALAGTTITLSTVPNGVRTIAKLNAYVVQGATGVVVYFSPTDANNDAPSTAGAPLSTMGGEAAAVTNWAQNALFSVLANTSQQIRGRTSAASTTTRIAVVGWSDSRGRNS